MHPGDGSITFISFPRVSSILSTLATQCGLVLTCFAVISLALYVLFYFPKEAAREFNKWEQTKNLDYVGMFLLTAGLVLFILGIMTGGNPYPWTSAKVLGMLISGAISLIALVVYGEPNCLIT